MNLLVLYLYFLYIFTQGENEVCSTTTTRPTTISQDFSSTTQSSKTKTKVYPSVKSWIDTSIPNHTKEIMRKFGNMLTKEYSNREKIAINTIDEIPYFVTNINNQSVEFTNLHLNYEIDNKDYSDFNEFKCDEYLQVNISKLVGTLTITGWVGFTHRFTVSLEKVLISNIRKVQVVNNQIVQINETVSETIIQYAEMKTQIKANERNTPLILSATPSLLEKLKEHFHRKIDNSILEKINDELPVPDDFQCSTNGIGTYSSLLNKMYIIDENERDEASTHTIGVGPIVINGFYNISVITWEYAWSPDNKSYRKTVMNLGPLNAKSDWSIASYRRNGGTYRTATHTDMFVLQNAKLISIFKPVSSEELEQPPTTTSTENPYIFMHSPRQRIRNYGEDYFSMPTIPTTENFNEQNGYNNGYNKQQLYNHIYSFETEVETRVSERDPSVIDDVLCANVEKLISKSFLDSLNVYYKDHNYY